MKKLNLTFGLAAIVLIAAAYSSQKKVLSSISKKPTNTSYTSDNTPNAQPIKANPEVIIEPEPKIHIVQKGESLWVIATQYGLTVKALAEANNIENTSLIKINQELVIPEKKEKEK